MGTWGAGSYDNDDARDWVWLLEDGASDDVVQTTLDRVSFFPEGSYLEAPEAAEALAAAEPVAAALGRPHSALAGELEPWVARHAGGVAPRLLRSARLAVVRVRESSELRELWDESDDGEWLAEVDDLARRLEAPPAHVARQLAANGVIWRVLMDQGVAEGTPLSLDFCFKCPDQSSARELAAYVSTETRADAKVTSQRAGLMKKRFAVDGSTQPMPVSLEALDTWVLEMVGLAAAHGPSLFDGWGTAVP